MAIGQCAIGIWPQAFKELMPGTECDFLLFNRAQIFPENLPHPVDEYDFQVVSIPLRSVLPDASFFRLSYKDTGAYQTLFDESQERLFRFHSDAMAWNKNHGLLTFVMNFVKPQQNPMGRLLPRYDLRNLLYFTEKLNESLSEEIKNYNNAYLFDFDEIVTTFGRKYLQDDILYQSNHNAGLTDNDFAHDQSRLELPSKPTASYPARGYLYAVLACSELVAMYRTIRQIDMVKLVVVDIDDTLWRGVAAERTEHTHDMIEGWPMGLAEALGHLKRRGILLAVVSKNDEKVIAPIWSRLIGDNRLSLEDFAVRKINWRPKPDNIEEILQETNLLPRSVVFIDDNPVEREAVKAAFPEIRTFGPNPYLWRRILLWSAETQVSTITEESASRTEMVRAQVARESQRKRLSREEFLASLDLSVEVSEINNTEHSRFGRALELLNKSNQYNTTGRRWTKQECTTAFNADTSFFLFDAKDRFTAYGTVGVVIVCGANIVQFVMSCRVVGMDVEIAAVAELLRIVRERIGAPAFTAELRETELNLLARDLWRRCGFVVNECGQWVRPAVPALPRPGHVSISVAALGNQLLGVGS
jgi:FkbH-like protein